MFELLSWAGGATVQYHNATGDERDTLTQGKPWKTIPFSSTIFH